jgi:SsrA-binding protein
MSTNISIKNRKASFEYSFLEKFIAGIQLTGTEIKSIRMGKVNLVDSYCFFTNDELWVRGIHIAEYAWGSYNNHAPNRDRKLLLNRKELTRLKRKVSESSLTIIAIRLFVNDKGLAKLDIALAKGKREYDRRQDKKQKDARREMERID